MLGIENFLKNNNCNMKNIYLKNNSIKIFIKIKSDYFQFDSVFIKKITKLVFI